MDLTSFARVQIGATAANSISFGFPAALLLWSHPMFGEVSDQPSCAQRSIGWVLLTASGVLLVGGIYNAAS